MHRQEEESPDVVWDHWFSSKSILLINCKLFKHTTLPASQPVTPMQCTCQYLSTVQKATSPVQRQENVLIITYISSRCMASSHSSVNGIAQSVYNFLLSKEGIKASERSKTCCCLKIVTTHRRGGFPSLLFKWATDISKTPRLLSWLVHGELPVLRGIWKETDSCLTEEVTGCKARAKS